MRCSDCGGVTGIVRMDPADFVTIKTADSVTVRTPPVPFCKCYPPETTDPALLPPIPPRSSEKT